MSTLVTILSTDLITNSRTDINANFAALNTDKIETSTLDTDTTLAANSDLKIATQKAVKAYIDALGGQTFLVPTGAVFPYGGSTAPANFLLCDGSAISRATYATLFGIIGTNFGTGDGSTTFNLPDLRSRIPVGKGTGTVTASGTTSDVDTTGDTLTVASNNTKWVTGMAVVFTLASGTITGLVSTTTYYVIRSSSTLIKLASTLANAQKGTPIDLTAKSSPVWTITGTLTARTLGEIGGEEAHAMSTTELVPHAHTVTPANAYLSSTNNGGAQNTGGTQPAGTTGGGTLFQNTDTSGGNAAMNVMNPFVVLNYIIKT